MVFRPNHVTAGSTYSGGAGSRAASLDSASLRGRPSTTTAWWPRRARAAPPGRRSPSIGSRCASGASPTVASTSVTRTGAGERRRQTADPGRLARSRAASASTTPGCVARVARTAKSACSVVHAPSPRRRPPSVVRSPPARQRSRQLMGRRPPARTVLLSRDELLQQPAPGRPGAGRAWRGAGSRAARSDLARRPLRRPTAWRKRAPGSTATRACAAITRCSRWRPGRVTC